MILQPGVVRIDLLGRAQLRQRIGQFALIGADYAQQMQRVEMPLVVHKNGAAGSRCVTQSAAR